MFPVLRYTVHTSDRMLKTNTYIYTHTFKQKCYLINGMMCNMCRNVFQITTILKQDTFTSVNFLLLVEQ